MKDSILNTYIFMFWSQTNLFRTEKISIKSYLHFILSPLVCCGLGVIMSPRQTDSKGHYHYNGIFTNFLPHFYGPITDYLTTTNIPLSCCCIGQWDKIWPKIFLWIKWCMLYSLFCNMTFILVKQNNIFSYFNNYYHYLWAGVEDGF